ncbi:MAG: hypothetical protein M3540_09095 [Actinomycetota bacterium]|nr:hypothetical protein [Actinomycetota bacterium]
MNTFLPETYVEVVHRLAIGLEPLDSTRPSRIARPLDVAVEGPAGRLARSRSGRYKLVYGPDVATPIPPAVTTPVEVRFIARDRRYVPRRLRFSISPESAILAAEGAGGSFPAAQRSWRPRLFPGAAYDVSETATGFRGRVTRGGAPVRWTRVEASVNGSVLGRAHGDDRGEFLLLLGPNLTNLGELDPLQVKVTVRAPVPPLPVDPNDALADLRVEPTSGPGLVTVDVLTGVQPPPAYAVLTERPGVAVRFGRIASLQPFAIP